MNLTTAATTALALSINSSNGCFPEDTANSQLDDIDEEDFAIIQNVVSIIVPIIFGLIGILGFLGNTTVIVLISANPIMHSTTNILIINLAVADLLFVIFCIPFTATDFVMPYWPFGNVWCKCVQYIIIVTAAASVYTLVLMSIDRYLAVVHPVNSISWRTAKNAAFSIGALWILILTVSIPVLMIHGEHEVYEKLNVTELKRCSSQLPFEEKEEAVARTPPVAAAPPLEAAESKPSFIPTVCSILSEEDWPAFQITFFTVSFVVPLMLITVLYVLMLVRLYKVSRVSAESRRGRKRVTSLVLIVVGVFAVCWCPIQIILVVKSVKAYPLTSETIVIQIISHVLAYANSCVNPFLYAFLSENFRKVFFKAVKCRYCKDDPESHNLNNIASTTKVTTRGCSSVDIL
ncbi:allatostatin-A receptor-like [Trichogramma pretiosum]|uniref:allatostatin-A receptor-like n=1 Tax=Trichogramma pretiosum TaxID=7493 RepID=UPI0006C98133|nr:allatostatin-A receptor-like [Trichogramma pretiosum]XP_014236737.1 allatostatin-A receptor-like [Trichogramma pretiosum]XP_023316299.1 allatostatin-A receptor-like [Trichogramma pretiosum]XP_023316300.1 allatostatin-A receptor-like [Trichogramma pretiosum]